MLGELTERGPMTAIRRTLVSTVVALAGVGVLSALLVALRSHVSEATPALLLILPVVGAASLGGWMSGLIVSVAGFFAYDLLFIRPYDSLSVDNSDEWVALVVYVLVGLVVAKIVVFLRAARAEARSGEEETRRLYVLSDRLIADTALPGLLDLVVSTIQRTFGARWAALLLPSELGEDGHANRGALSVKATAGAAPTDDELAALIPSAGRLESLGGQGSSGPITRVVLTAATRPVGLLAMSGAELSAHDWALLLTYANHAALAIDRSRLRDQAVRSELLEEVDRLRRSLLGAVSHDLRTPLASIKTAVSTLRGVEVTLSDPDRNELLAVIEEQTDSLARLVTNLLDMTRIDAGALMLQPEVGPITDLVDGALSSLGLSGSPAVLVAVPPDLPPVEVDHPLMVQVIANLLDNALRYTPAGVPVEISAHLADGCSLADLAPPRSVGSTTAPAESPARLVQLEVSDHGPGVPLADRDRIFEIFSRGSGSRAGLGLTICRSFVEAHGQRLWVRDAPGGGAQFVVTLPAAWVPSEVA